MLTQAEADRLQASARVLLDDDRPSEAISLLEDGVERARHDSSDERTGGRTRTSCVHRGLSRTAAATLAA
jgi:hypothetical protein